jgi:ABC-2 type transport system ATP-binding protein
MTELDEIVVETQALTKQFGSLVAVDALDLAIRRGEVFGFLGPNGAGKSTTIRLLLDFLRPTAGRSAVLGGAGSDPRVRARIGYLPAELAIPPRYRARDLVGFFSAIRGGLDKAYFAELLGRFDLDPDRPAGQLSTGNRRKIGLVQAFVHRPELLVLDEPTSGLDPLLQHEFNLLVREAVRDGATVLLSSHVLPEVEALADRIGILRRGRLIVTASPDELRRRARRRIHLTLARADDAGARFAGVPGVIDVTTEGRSVHLTVEGSVDAALKAAATLEVSSLATDDGMDLEEVFLGFYRDRAPA